MQLARGFRYTVRSTKKSLHMQAFFGVKVYFLDGMPFKITFSHIRINPCGIISILPSTPCSSAREIASRLTATPQVQLALAEEMDRAGLTRSYRVSKLADACEHPDPGIALKSLDMAFRLADDFPAIRSKSMVVHAECMPVDLSNYGG